MFRNRFIYLFFVTLLLISACGGGDSSKLPEEPVNLAPVVNAGENQTVDEQSQVTFNATATDNDGSIFSYQWTQVSGMSVDLENATNLSASFTAPIVLSNQGSQQLKFSLAVIDNEGKTAVDQVTVNVNPVNGAPIADAGEGDGVYLVAEMITLDCYGSADTDSDVYSVSWSQLSGEMAEIKNPSNCKSQVKLAGRASEVTFQLTVTDGEGVAAKDEVTIIAKPYEGERNKLSNNPLFYNSGNSSYSTGRLSHFINQQDKKLYISSKEGKYLSIVNVNESLNPQEISRLEFEGEPVNQLIIEKNKGFQLIQKSDFNTFVIVIIDLSELDSPEIIGKVSFDDWLMAIDVKENYIYALDFNGLVVFDINDVKKPEQLMTLELGNMGAVIHDVMKISGDFIYATSSNMLNVIDISAPATPKLVKSFPIVHNAHPHLNAGATSLVIDESYLFVNKYIDTPIKSKAFGINVFDISTPQEPVLISDIATKGNNYSLAVHNRKAYILASYFSLGGFGSWGTFWYRSWLEVYDLSDAAKPVYLGIHDIDDNSITLAVDDDVIYAMSQELAIYDLPLFSSPLSVGQSSTGVANTVSVKQGIAFIAKDSAGIDIIDATVANSPSLITNIEMTNKVSALQVQENYLFAGLNSGSTSLNIYDVSNANTPNLLAQFGGTQTVQSMKIEDNIVYLSNGYGGGLQLVDINNAQAPMLLSSLDGNVSDTDINEGFAYSVGSLNLYQFDISNPNMPQNREAILSPVTTGANMTSIAVNHNDGYIVTQSDEEYRSCLLSLDISDIFSIELTDWFCANGYAGKIHREGSLLYLPWQTSGLFVFDTSSSQAEVKAQYFSGSSINDVDVNNGKMYIGDNDGLTIFDSTEYITSEQNYYRGNALSILAYQLSWTIDKPVKFKCLVSGGSCSITTNEATSTAQASWTLPEVAGDYEITIIGGNSAFYNVHRDKVIVEQ